MTATTATPAINARYAARHRKDARDRWMRARRADAARNGYRGPLTRTELAAITVRAELTALAGQEG